ncbi:TrkH family potassium uptake protein [Hominifimenecus sp. rT4P-3]|uniref:TrkH family potassium uptake protein n=1 Tax=Hominifimenecus sp. rT4P-3 TaxID=3242979 RepID=UPI003DA5FD65
MSFSKLSRIRPAQIIIFGFLILILTGSFLLMLPISSKSGEMTSFSDALFTATSATCVTGLVVFDTFQHWSLFGQAVILLLIQIGGMGVVTMAVAIFIISGKKIGLRQRFVMQESISAPQMGGIIRMTGFILRATLCFEGIGALILAIRFCPKMGLSGIWYAIFHSISAFCNAGFDLMGKESPFSSLTGYASDPLIQLPIILLIVIGGIGFYVWSDIRQNKWHIHRYHFQTKLVLFTSLLLILLPSLYLFFFEFSRPEWAGMGILDRIWASLFQAVTVRTAGFNTVNLAAFHSVSLLLLILLMLVGGSPGSTAGGFKTTSLAVVLLCLRSVFKKQANIEVFHRRIPSETLRNAVTLLTLYIILFLTGSALLCLIDGISLRDALFECASAIGTVGLSLGITSTLSLPSHLILIALMYFGRVGGLTMLYAVSSGHTPAPSQMPQEKISVG